MRGLLISILLLAVQSLALANEPPVAYHQDIWYDGSAPVSGQLTGYDQDGDQLTFSPAHLPQNGAVSIEPNGAFVYTPNSWDGFDRFGFTVFDGNIISNEAFVNLHVFNRPPVANAGPDQNMYTGDTAYLNGSATDADGDPIILWRWLVAESPTGSDYYLSNSDVPLAQLQVSTPGDYVLFLFVIDSNYNTSVPDYVTVHAHNNLPPVAIVTADKTTVTVGEQVCFDGSQSYDPEGGSLTYFWILGDGSEHVTTSTVCHTYQESGEYSVRFTVTDERNAFDTEILLITVNPPHIQAYSQVVWCDGSSAVGGQLNATDQNGHPLTYTLTAPPENGGVVIEPNGVFVYTPGSWDGNDRFWFTATDSNYVSNEAFVNLYVFERPPIAEAGPDQNIFTGDTAILQGSATSPDGISIVSWMWFMISAPEGSSWNFSTTDRPMVSLQVLTPGDYVVALRVVDANGNSSALDYVTIHAHDNLPPVAIATADKITITAGEQVCFDGSQSYDPEGGPLTYFWNLDDGPGIVYTPTVCHTYQERGEYTVGFTVTDERNAFDTEILIIIVNLPPEAIPTATPSFGEAPLTVEFAANAFDPDNDPLTYYWDFNAPLSPDNNSTLENPTHIYEQNGIYHVALDVCDGLATVNRAITIRVGQYGIDYLLGDIDFDGDVDFEDVNEFMSAYLTETGDPDYNSDADLDPNDGFIDLYDFALLANDWGETLP